MLPLVAVGSRKFEEMCRDLASLVFPQLVLRASLKRVNGTRQFGADVEGFDEDGEPAVVISAKCYKRIRAWDFRVWLDDFVRHLESHWAGRRIRYFILAITHESNDDAMNEAARALARELKRRGISFRLWNAEEISKHLRRDPTLVDRYFHPAWRDAVSALPATAAPAAPMPAALAPPPTMGNAGFLHQALAQFEDRLNEHLDSATAQALDAAIGEVTRGRPGVLRQWHDSARTDAETWKRLSPATRCRALRAVAMVLLAQRDADGAERLLDEADALAPSVGNAPRALLLHVRGAPEDALALLLDVAVTRDREIKAAILLETGRVTEAAETVNAAVGEAVTAEILRLRSIVALLQGRLDDAVSDAQSAVERMPAGLAELLGLAAARFYRALTDGVRPMVGRPPEPLHPGLVRAGAAAQEDLAAAAADFDRARLMAEEALQTDIETWRLAALLMNPARSDEAAAYAAELLDRPMPDPLAVAWAMAYDLADRSSHVKKAYGDAIRGGTATPSHLVVLALLAAGNERPDRGRALLRRYADRFPVAGDFLKGWRARFGDATVAQDATARAWNLARRKGEHELLLDLAQAEGADPEIVLAAAEFFVWKRAWADLDALRTPLASIRTRRAVELSALGALKADDAAGCLCVLEDGAAVFEGGRLPAALVHLRIAANDSLGRHAPVITDLMDLRRDGGDPFAHARVMDALVRIGDLEGLRREAERALERGDLDPRHALNVAFALRAAAPATARRALALAAGVPPPDGAVAAVAALAAELGLTEVHEQMFAAMLSDPDASRHVLRIDTVEAAVALFERASGDHRERFRDWLGGRMPFAVATAQDPGVFGRMFLATVEGRHDHLGDPFPMLLLTGAPRSAVPATEDNELRLDLSALLLASRLGMLADLERTFRLRVPRSTGEALIELEAAYGHPVEETIAGVRELLEGRNRVLVHGALPEAAVPVESPDTPGELSAPAVRALIERAFQSGHLDRHRADEACRLLGAAEAEVRDVEAGVVLGRLSATRLAGARILSQVARGTRIYILATEAETLRRDVEGAVEERRLRGHVSDLRHLLAERLADGRWTTFERGPDAEEDGPTIPAHVRCLLESISTQRHGPSLLWIEDRALSRATSLRLLHLPDVLDLLRDRNAVDVVRREHLLEEARRGGYAWLPYDFDAFLTAVEAAPVSGAVLVETPALAVLRKSAAWDTTLMRHLDITPERGPDGHIVGEARRLLDAWGIARDLLARIWEDADGSEDVRRARSDWVWANLRIDRFEGLPADASVETRRHLRAMHLASLLDLPLLGSLGNKAKPLSSWKGYVAWVFDAWANPQAEADSRLREDVANIVGGHLSGLLERPEAVSDAEAQAVRISLLRLVREYLVLLPEAWADAMSSRPGVGDRMGLTDVMVLTIKPDDEEAAEVHQAEVTEVAAAYSALRAGTGEGRRSAELRLLDGQLVRIEETVAPDGHQGAAVILGDRRVEIDGLSLALLEANPAARSIPVEHRRRLLNPLGIITADDLAAIEHTDDPQARFAALGRLLDLDLHRRLEGLEETIRTRGSLGLADLVLPTPASVRTFLRLPLEQAPTGFASAACKALERDLGADEAARRLAGLPFDPEDGYLRRRGAELAARPEGEDRRPTVSPFGALMDLLALASAGDRTRIDAAIDGLLTAVNLHGALWLALLRHFAAAAARDPAWRRLEPEIRLAFLWSLTDQFALRISIPGVDGRPIAEWLERAVSFPFPEQIQEDGLPVWYVRLTAKASEALITACIVARALRGGVDELAGPQALAALSAVVGRDEAQPWLPNLELVPPPPDVPQELWVGLDPLGPDAMGRWLGPEHPFVERDADAIARALLDTTTTPETAHLIPPLLSVVDVRLIEGNTLDRIRAALVEASGSEVFEPSSGAMQRILSVEAAVRSLDADLDGMTAILTARAARCEAQWPATGIFDAAGARATEFLFEAALRFALAMPRPLPDRLATFAGCIEALVRTWPATASIARRCLDRLVRVTDMECGTALWPALLRLRGA